MPTTALFAHVPVDCFTIVSGFGPDLILTILEGIDRDGHYDVTLTLKTGASKRSFRRKVRITTLVDFNADDTTFICILEGRGARASYSPREREGSLAYM